MDVIALRVARAGVIVIEKMQSSLSNLRITTRYAINNFRRPMLKMQRRSLIQRDFPVSSSHTTGRTVDVLKGYLKVSSHVG